MFIFHLYTLMKLNTGPAFLNNFNEKLQTLQTFLEFI